MQSYNSERDYPLVLLAAENTGSIALAPIAHALQAAGIVWPNLNSASPEAAAIDKDILRAWRQCGYTR